MADYIHSFECDNCGKLRLYTFFRDINDNKKLSLDCRFCQLGKDNSDDSILCKRCHVNKKPELFIWISKSGKKTKEVTICKPCRDFKQNKYKQSKIKQASNLIPDIEMDPIVEPVENDSNLIIRKLK